MRRVALGCVTLLAGCRFHFDPLGDDAGGDASGLRFCEALVPPAGFETLLCRDFDDGTDALAGWDFVNATPPASVTMESMEFTSAPAALRTRLEASPPMCSYSRVRASWPQPLVRAQVAFDVRLGGLDTNPLVDVTYLNVRIPQTQMTGIGCQLLLSDVGGGGGGLLYEQVSFPIAVDHPLTFSPPHQTWVRFEIDVDWADRGVEVRFDGVPGLANRAIMRPDCIDAASGPIEVYFGAHCENGGGPRETRFDNLAVFGVAP